LGIKNPGATFLQSRQWRFEITCSQNLVFHLFKFQYVELFMMSGTITTGSSIGWRLANLNDTWDLASGKQVGDVCFVGGNRPAFAESGAQQYRNWHQFFGWLQA
jgi:hypothetical protein